MFFKTYGDNAEGYEGRNMLSKCIKCGIEIVIKVWGQKFECSDCLKESENEIAEREYTERVYPVYVNGVLVN